MTRREFSRPIKAAIIKRAMNERGQIVCEGCDLVLGKKPYHIDHTIPDALFEYKKRDLTADDGKLLGVECCHKPKTVFDVGAIAKVKRQESKIRLGIKPRSSFPKLPAGWRYDWKLGRNVKVAQ